MDNGAVPHGKANDLQTFLPVELTHDPQGVLTVGEFCSVQIKDHRSLQFGHRIRFIIYIKQDQCVVFRHFLGF